MRKFTLFTVMVVAPLLVAAYGKQPERPKSQGSDAAKSQSPDSQQGPSQPGSKKNPEDQMKENSLSVHYLEIVTPSVKETCEALEKAHRVTFGEPIAEFGNARTAPLKGGGRMGVRAPMRATEAPVVRPYLLVQNIDAALKAAVAAGGAVAMQPTTIPGQGTFAIYVLGGIDHGLWQL